MRGALSISLRPQFGSWLGWLVSDDRPLIFVLEPGQDAGDVVRQAVTIGYEQLLGVMSGDVDTWRAAGLPIVASELVAAPNSTGPSLTFASTTNIKPDTSPMRS